MKARMHFDTLTYANKLKAAGMDPKLAEVQALALVEALDDGVATKSDIAELRMEIHDFKVEFKNDTTVLKNEIISFKNEMTGLKSEVRGEFDVKLATLKSDLIHGW